MNNRAVTLSLGMAILAVFFVQSYVASIEEKAKKDFGAYVNVVVAKKDLKEMATIDDVQGMIALREIPKQFLEPGAIYFEKKNSESDSIKDLETLAGYVAVVPIKEGTQISFSKITEPGLRTGLSPQITPGRRGFSVPVNEVSGVAKLVKPGDRVDVIAVLDLGSARDSKVVKTVLQDVPILAVGRNVTNNVARSIDADPFTGKSRIRALTQFDGFASVTLEVDPAQAQMLALILSNQSNTVTLSLRNNDDVDRVAVGGMGVGEVLGADPAAQRRLPGSR